MCHGWFSLGRALLVLGLAACGGSPASSSHDSSHETSADGGNLSARDAASAHDANDTDTEDASSPPDAGTVLPTAQSSVHRDPASGIPAAALKGAVSANNAFAADLFSRVRSSEGSSNVLTSPISASLALTMTYAGAVGPTATQMATALHFGAAAGSIFDGQNALSQALDARAAAALAVDTSNAQGGDQPAPSPSDYQLQVVNSIWGEQTYPWESPFLDVMARSYGAGVYLQDFEQKWDEARQAINEWVSAETADKINDLLPSGALDTTTRMVLVNAIHLKLPWESPFDVSATAPGTFTKADGTTVSANFMNRTQAQSYTDDGQAQIVALPLAGRQLEVVIALPHGDLATYEAGLTGGSPSAFAPPTSSAWVQLSVPKFAFTAPTFSLVTELQAMGMTQAFDRTAADFSGMCAHPPDGGRLYIENVLQKAMVAMQETGVEAAAATAVIVGSLTSVEMPPTPIPMVVDRPFLIAIVDAPTGAILFAGHIKDPTDAGSP